MFHLVDDWKWIVLRAWQFRVNIIAALLSGLEVWFAFADPDTLPIPIPHGTFAALAMVTSILANLFRVLQQRRNRNAGN